MEHSLGKHTKEWKYEEPEAVLDVPFYCDDCEKWHFAFYSFNTGKDENGYYIEVMEGDEDGNWDVYEWIDSKIAEERPQEWADFFKKWYDDFTWVTQAWKEYEEDNGKD